MDVFGQSGCNRAAWLYLGKVVDFLQGGSIRAKLLYSDKGGCILAKWLYSAKVVVFG